MPTIRFFKDALYMYVRLSAVLLFAVHAENLMFKLYSTNSMKHMNPVTIESHKYALYVFGRPIHMHICECIPNPQLYLSKIKYLAHLKHTSNRLIGRIHLSHNEYDYTESEYKLHGNYGK